MQRITTVIVTAMTVELFWVRKKNRKLGWGLWLNVERGRERKRYAKMELWVIK